MSEMEFTAAQLRAAEQGERELDAMDEETEGRFLSQDFGVGGPPAEVKVRPLAVIEAELHLLKQDTRQKETALLCNYIEIGRRLEEAKAQLAHGQWGEWLKKMEVAQSTANNFMLLYRKYGDEQQSLFGAQAKSQTFGNLTYSKALKLLAIEDEEERERFVVENNVEHMSVRELDKALKARDVAEEKAAAAKDEADRLREDLHKSHMETVDANIRARDAQEALEKQRAKAQRLQDALSEANTSAQAAEEEHARLAQDLEELRSRPAEADTAAVEAARQAAIDEMTAKVDKAEAAAKKAAERQKNTEKDLEAAQKELAELKAKGPEVRELTQEEKDALTAEAVNKVKAESAEQIRNLEKKLASTDPNVAEFKVRVDSWQKDYRKIMEVLNRIAQDDVKQAARNLVKAALEQMNTA